MTLDFFTGQLRLLLVAVLAYCAGAGILSTATNTFLGAISVPLLALFAPWLWSIYVNINGKIVPKSSIAIAGDTALAVDKLDANGKITAGATITQLASTAKVVG